MWGVSTYTFGSSHSSKGDLKKNLTLSLTFRVNKGFSQGGSNCSVCGVTVPKKAFWQYVNMVILNSLLNFQLFVHIQ